MNSRVIVKAISFCVIFTGLFMLLSLAHSFVPNKFERTAHGIIGTAAAFITTILFLRFDKRTFRDIGLEANRTTILKFLQGIIAGIAIMGTLAGAVLFFSGASIQTNPASNPGHFLFMTLPLIPLAFMEELAFRGYPMRILQPSIGMRGALLTTSILFALYHVANGWSLATSFLGPAIWGLVFGLAAIASKGIALPTGLHYAANLTTSAFGATNNSVCLWLLTNPEDSKNRWPTSDILNLVAAMVLLVFGIIAIELYRKRIRKVHTSLVRSAELHGSA